ncbi:RND transporter MFP subunit [Aromatoleum bremense]|uniref:RND transporter MFP subunit n=1 Tax=Aromatoleum bremense TaxID=76115 RepID=A0ABX1P0B4_9RHOO|nr:RND transporter MFP subunit [Aromatoleum bremense]
MRWRGPASGTAGPRHRTVRVAAADGTLQERRVEVGVSNRVQAQVLSGLEEGDRVVSGAALRTDAPAAARRTPRL